MDEGKIAALFRAVDENAGKLPYLNLKTEGDVVSYGGWVSDFRVYKRADKEHTAPTRLDLFPDRGLFLLFLLASCWSRTGPFENGVSFTLYVKDNWQDFARITEDFIEREKARRERAAREVLSVYEDISRKEVAFREDFYDGARILAQNWEQIKNSLLLSEKSRDYTLFIRVMRSIDGLGSGEKAMRIKIPLILRELRIAGRYADIPKEWCSVPDGRVLKACKKLDISFRFPDAMGRMPRRARAVDADMRQVLKKSQMIHSVFGELYDIALFAHKDLFPQEYPPDDE